MLDTGMDIGIQGNPGYSISSRDDLHEDSPSCGGGYDTKASSYSLYKQGMVTYAQSGPTQQEGVFSFATTKAPCGNRFGLPTKYNFAFEEMK
eukprot:gene22946-9330_t